MINSSENNFDGNCDGIFNKGSNSKYCGSSGCSSNDGKVDRNRLKIVELLMNDTALKSSPFRDTSDVTSPILTANREKLTPLHVSSLFPIPEFA